MERVDSLVFPLLELDKKGRSKFLQVPDVQHNERLSHYVEVLEKLIEQALTSTKRELSRMKRFMYIFKSQPEGIVFALKKKSFLLAQEQQMAEELAQQLLEKEKSGESGVISPADSRAVTPKSAVAGSSERE